MKKTERLAACCMVAAALAIFPTASVAQECFDAPTGLIGWWALEGDALAEVGARGTVIGAQVTPGFVGDALEFQGGNDRVAIGTPTELQSAFAVLTLDAWIRPTQSVTRGTILSKTEFDGWAIRMVDGLLRADLRLSTGIVVLDAGAIPLNSWSHVAFTYDGTMIRNYLNGTEVGSIPASGIIENTDNATTDVFIGNESAAGGSVQDAPRFAFIGDIDEVEIFNRALTANEVQAIFDAGSAGMCKDEDGDGFRPPEDCDESDASINPDGLELPGNFVDENCDGNLGDCSPCNVWRNHGEYIRCTSQAVSVLVNGGALTEEEGDALVTSAARSDVGKKSFVPPPECTP